MPKLPQNPNWTKIGLFFAFLPIIAIAGYVSFGHIYDVVLAHGQNRITAFLTPFSVDGLITVGYLKNRVVMGSISVWRRIWCPVAIYGGLAVSLAANMESSHFADPISTGVAGWPALALFIGIKALGIKVPNISDMVHAIAEAVKTDISVEPVQSVPVPVKKATPAKKAIPAKVSPEPVKTETPKKAATPRKRTPAKKTAPSLFQAPVIDEVAQALS